MNKLPCCPDQLLLPCISSPHTLCLLALQAKAQAGGEFNVFENLSLAQRPAVLSFALAEGAGCDGLPVAELKQLHRARAAGIWKVKLTGVGLLTLWGPACCADMLLQCCPLLWQETLPVLALLAEGAARRVAGRQVEGGCCDAHCGTEAACAACLTS